MQTCSIKPGVKIKTITTMKSITYQIKVKYKGFSTKKWVIFQFHNYYKPVRFTFEDFGSLTKLMFIT